MNEIEIYIRKLLTRKAELEAEIHTIEQKIGVALEIERDITDNGNVQLSLEKLETQSPFEGLTTYGAVKKYLEIHPEIDIIRPYQLYLELEKAGHKADTTHYRQTVASYFKRFVDKSIEFIKIDVGVYRRAPKFIATGNENSALAM